MTVDGCTKNVHCAFVSAYSYTLDHYNLPKKTRLTIFRLGLLKSVFGCSYEGHPKSFQPRHIRQEYFPKSMDW